MMRFDFRQFDRTGRFTQAYEVVSRKPSWVVRFAILSAVLVVVIPLAFLAMAGLLVGVTVFIVLGFVAKVLSLFQGRPTQPHVPTEGRRNVRVIHEE